MEHPLRRGTLGLLTFMGCGLLALLMQALVQGWSGATLLTLISGLIVSGVLVVAAWRGWSHTPIATILVAVALAAGGPPDASLDTGNTLTLLIPAIVALIVGRAWWVVGATIPTLALFLARSGGASVQEVNLADGVIFGMLVGGLWFGRWVLDQALGQALAHAARADAAFAQASAQAQQLASASERQGAQLAEQQRLLEVISTLELPAITLADQVLLVPLLGHFDQQRAQRLTSRLLWQVHQEQARSVVLDLSGVVAVDVTVLEALLALDQALRLLGCQVLFSSIPAQVAAILPTLGHTVDQLLVVRSPQDALRAISDA
jgi:rsbT co-antagonist protein RsbR